MAGAVRHRGAAREQLPDTNGLAMSSALAVLIVALWVAVWLGLGAWRTRTRDA